MSDANREPRVGDVWEGAPDKNGIVRRREVVRISGKFYWYRSWPIDPSNFGLWKPRSQRQSCQLRTWLRWASKATLISEKTDE